MILSDAERSVLNVQTYVLAVKHPGCGITFEHHRESHKMLSTKLGTTMELSQNRKHYIIGVGAQFVFT